MVENTACTKCFGSLGIESRMKIYQFLKDSGESTVTKIVEISQLTQPTVSYHLKEMKDSGLLKAKKQGKEVYYSINTECTYGGEDCFLSQTNFPSK